MVGFKIIKADITRLDVDCIVNAANEQLMAGGGVCGAIFKAAGRDKLQKACNAIGHCRTGSAVITPGFDLKAKYIIHTVGPIWRGGGNGERDKLTACYVNSLELAKENGCHTIAFPLISSGIYGYPVEDAWKAAFEACGYAAENTLLNYDMDIKFAVLSDNMVRMGMRISDGSYDACVKEV